MTADQTPDYQADPITQRDGSSLANSNCRMASIATGLDYDTRGAKTSTGKKMRTYTDDQSGGTDSGDAKQAWDRGYNENLDVQDGNTFDDALRDLKAYRMVHLDVWHATVGGPCLSGSGAYGHTMAVAPDCKDGKWLVADPWCSPGKWSRVSESKLRAGAEEWGRRVTRQATSGAGHRPTLRELIAAAKLLMSRYHAGGDEDPSEDPGDTGGGVIMYTATTGHGPGGGKAVGIAFNMSRWVAERDIPVYLEASTSSDRITTLKAGTAFSTFGPKAAVDSDGKDTTWYAVRVQTGALIPGDQPSIPAILWCRREDMPDSTPSGADWDSSVWGLAGDPAGRWPCPPPPPGGDCSAEVAEAIAARDAEWQEWLLAGSPGEEG